MKMKRGLFKSKRLVAVLSVCVIVLVGVIVSVAVFNNRSKADNFKKDTVVNILHTNDIHGDVEN
ncbi:MAG: hypothetical protein E7262_03105 [Lachnospiraceae bacterium]|nr:hypothetical protein [Lachnospiraceae bacterium]